MSSDTKKFLIWLLLFTADSSLMLYLIQSLEQTNICGDKIITARNSTINFICLVDIVVHYTIGMACITAKATNLITKSRFK